MAKNPSSPMGRKKEEGTGQLYIDTGYAIPERYDEDRLVVLPRDPYWMFAYWDIADKTKAKVRKKYGRDIFGQSQTVLRVYEVLGQKSVISKDIPAAVDTRNWYIKVDSPGKSWYVELGLKTKDGKYIMLLRSNTISLPVGRVSDITDEQWMLIREDFEKLLKLSGVDRIGIGSLEMAKFLAKRWEFLGMVSSGAFSGISSRGFKIPQVGLRKFWLLADAELIVYGATEPTANISVNNKPIKLNPDGTFSIRVDFPDGKKEFVIKAVSADKIDTKKITITADRKTK
ncbi:MAG: DUF4912 domain-containing protein [Elusimicrobiota bacterium]